VVRQLTEDIKYGRARRTTYWPRPAGLLTWNGWGLQQRLLQRELKMWPALPYTGACQGLKLHQSERTCQREQNGGPVPARESRVKGESIDTGRVDVGTYQVCTFEQLNQSENVAALTTPEKSCSLSG